MPADFKRGGLENRNVAIAVARRASILTARSLSFRAEPQAESRNLSTYLSCKTSAPRSSQRGFNLLRSRPLLQLRLPSDRVTDITIMLVVDELFALIFGSGRAPVASRCRIVAP